MKIKKIFYLLILFIFLIHLFLTSLSNAQSIPSFFIEVDKSKVDLEEEFIVSIKGNNITDMYAFEIVLLFDTDKLEYISSKTKNQGYSTNGIVKENKIFYGFTLIGDKKPLEGEIDLCSFAFKKTIPSISNVELQSLRIVYNNLEDETFLINKKIEIATKGYSENKDAPTTSPSPTLLPTSTPPTSPIIPVEEHTSTQDLDETIQLSEIDVPGSFIFSDIENHWSKEYALKLDR